MQIFIAYAIFTSLSWIKSTTFTPMVVVGKLSSFRSSLVGKLIGYQEVAVHNCDEESTDPSDQKDDDRKNVDKNGDKNGDNNVDKSGDKNDDRNDDIVKTSNEKLSLFDSGTVQRECMKLERAVGQTRS